MKQKIYNPSYKVHRAGEGLYSVSFSTKQHAGPRYISRVRIGSRNFYHVSKNAPLFPTLRDAVMHVVFGG